MRTELSSIAVCAALLFSPAYAADDVPPPSTTAVPSKTVIDPAATPTAPRAATASDLVVTDEQVKDWIDKAVFSSDAKNIGEVAAISRDASGKVIELHADIGGFLGVGEQRVRVMPPEFKFGGNTVVLNVTAEDAKKLPHITK
ncbi:MAG: hypothetical protein HOP09_07090 [Hyphomicrobium sp.]|nr:hypothetical protein [Hyphomicrobium sp.]